VPFTGRGGSSPPSDTLEAPDSGAFVVSPAGREPHGIPVAGSVLNGDPQPCPPSVRPRRGVRCADQAEGDRMATIKHWLPIAALMILLALALGAVFGGGPIMLVAIPLALVVEQIKSGNPGRLVRAVSRRG
jgi:hypothetical protein